VCVRVSWLVNKPSANPCKDVKQYVCACVCVGVCVCVCICVCTGMLAILSVYQGELV